jgi:hypothetical protein
VNCYSETQECPPQGANLKEVREPKMRPDKRKSDERQGNRTSEPQNHEVHIHQRSIVYIGQDVSKAYCFTSRDLHSSESTQYRKIVLKSADAISAKKS